MVNKIFYVTGESEHIFQVGLRPAILGLAKRFDVKTDPINIEDEEESQSSRQWYIYEYNSHLEIISQITIFALENRARYTT